MVQVRVSEGVLEGEVNDNELGGQFYSFKGIPYAEPPVGDLRFKPPQPKKPWSGVRDAKKCGSVAYHVDMHYWDSAPIGSEDCLYLNVYTPDLSSSRPLPVMFYIHGGGLFSGSGSDDMYGPEFLVRHGVILVTINYRLEILGFLCLDTEDVPGNAGMKDQVAAMKWVKNNIVNFGGDPENITIFGHSAGAACIQCHLISPMTKGLFKRAIVKSGAFNSPWGIVFEPRERALAVARRLGFYCEDNKKLYEFFKSQPKETLVHIQLQISFDEKAIPSYDVHFGIVDEKQFGNNERFIYGDVTEMLRNDVHEGVELVVGYVEDEGLINMRSGIPFKTLCTLANEFREFFVPKQFAHNCTLQQKFEVGRRMQRYYFKNEKITMQNLTKLIPFYSMSWYTYPMFQIARIYSMKNKVYLYKFTGKTERNFMVNLLGLTDLVGDKIPVCHADDLNYVFPMKKMNLKLDRNSKSFRIIENITKLYTNFAKYGNPTPDDTLGFQWGTYNKDEQMYLEIDEKLTPGTEPDKAEVDFWENIFREFLPNYVPY